MLPLIGGLLGLLGGIGKSRAEARGAANQETMTRDQLEQQRWRDAQGSQLDAAGMGLQAELARRAQMLDAPERRTQQAVRGGLIANLQDAKFDLGDAIRAKMPGGGAGSGFSGGLRPSAFGQGARDAGQELQTQALGALRSGSDVMPEYDWRSLLMPREAQSSLAKPGKLDTILGILGGIGGGIDVYNATRKPPTSMGP